MKVQALKVFSDKAEGKIRFVGEEFEVTEKRFKEIKNLVKAIENKPVKKQAKKK